MRIALLAVTLLLSACGFHLRGHNLKPGEQMFAFHSIYLRTNGDTPFVIALKSGLEAYKIKLMPSADKADLTLEIVSESADKQILALNASGQAVEYILHYRISFRAYDRQLNDWLPASEIDMENYFSYDPSQVLAMNQEEQMIYQSLRADTVQQMLRRLSFAKRPQTDTRD